MPTFPISQTAFTTGEISDLARGRVDMQKYAESLQTARNTEIHAQGAISNRRGSLFGGPGHPAWASVSGPGAIPKLFPFVVDESTSYVIAMSGNTGQVWTSNSSGAPTPVTVSHSVTGSSTGSSTTLTVSADHSLISGQDVFLTGGTGDWAALNSDSNGAAPRYSASFVADASSATADVSELYQGNETSPIAIKIVSAAWHAKYSAGDTFDVWLSGGSTADAGWLEAQNLIGNGGRTAPRPSRYKLHVYHVDTGNVVCCELLWPVSELPAGAGADTGTDEKVNAWGAGTQEVFPKLPDLPSSKLSGGTGELVVNPLDPRKIVVTANSSGFSAGTAIGATLKSIVQFDHPWTSAQVYAAQHAQSLDTLTVVHQDTVPHDIVRFSDTQWICQPKRLTENTAPKTLLGTPNAPGETNLYSYRVVSVDGFPGDANSGTGKYSEASQVDVAANTPVSAAPNQITLNWAEAGHKRAKYYHIFRLDKSSPTYQYLDEVEGDVFTFVDTGASTPGTSAGGIRDQDTKDEGNFTSATNYPRTVNYNNQRLVFGGTVAEPERVWLSRVGDYRQFNLSSNTADVSGAVQFDLAVSTRLSSVYASAALQQLILLTDSGEISAGGGEGFGSMSPAAGGLTLYPQSYYGAEVGIMPALADDSAIFVQKKGGAIRDIRYRADGLAGAAFGSRDISVLASHLLENDTVRSVAFADSPDNTLYVVMDSGTMLCVTYSQEHGIVAFNKWDTGCASASSDKFMDVCVIPEGPRNGIYIVTQRYQSDTSGDIPQAADRKIFVERLSDHNDRRDVASHNHMDCAFAYEVPSTTILGARITNGTYQLKSDPVIGASVRVDVFEAPGADKRDNTSIDAYGQFTVTAVDGLWATLGNIDGTALSNVPVKVDGKDLDVKLPVDTFPAADVFHANTGWRSSGTYDLSANGVFYKDIDPTGTLPLPASVAWGGASTEWLTSYSSFTPDDYKASPYVSRDSSFIVFRSNNRKLLPAYTEQVIWKMDLDGSNARTLTSSGWALSAIVDDHPALSHDDGMLAFTRMDVPTGMGQIYTVASTGETGPPPATATNLSANSLAYSDEHPDWNNDSTKIVFQSTRTAGRAEIWVMNADGSGATRLTTSGVGESSMYPRFSHDGTKIVFSSNMGGTSEHRLWTMDADGSSQVRVGSVANNLHPSFTPDDTQIVYASDRGTVTGSDLYLCDVDGSDELQITSVPESYYQPATSHKTTETTKVVFAGEYTTLGIENTQIGIRDGGTTTGKASYFYFGETYTAEVETNPLRNANIPDTAASKRVPQVGFRVTNTHSFNVSVNGGEEIPWSAGDDVVGHNNALLYEGVGRVSVTATSAREQSVKITQHKPYSFTVSGLFPELEVESE